MQDFLKPPSYCPDAIATDVGWISPKTGELLISVRNLRQRIKDNEPQSEYTEESPSDLQMMLDKLTTYTISQPKEDERSVTQKILDNMSNNLPEKEDDRTDTQKILDKMTEQQEKKRGRGRPKKSGV
jgi:hypothetical protein